jgi:hypothetical protein
MARRRGKGASSGGGRAQQSAAKVPGSRRPPGGSRKGCPNRTTKALKEAWLAAFDEVGGVAYLVKLARSRAGSDRKAFVQGLIKIIPNAVEGELGVRKLEELVAAAAGLGPAEGSPDGA